MSKLPSINGTNKKISLINDEQDYNFTNKDKKRKDSAKIQQSPLQMIEDLKRKIQQQKNQIDNRNATIKGLQRNFQSISAIAKNQKANNAALRAQLDYLKENSDSGNQRATEFHEQLIKIQNQNKALIQQLIKLKKAHSQCDQQITINDSLKRNLKQSQSRYQKLIVKINKMQQQKLQLQRQIVAMKNLDKEKRSLNQRIIDLQQQVKKITDMNNSFAIQKQITQDQISRLKYDKQKIEVTVEQRQKKIKQLLRKQQNLEQQIGVLRKQIIKKDQLAQTIKSNMENKQMFAKMKTQEEQKIKIQIKALQKSLQQSRKAIFQLKQQQAELKNQNTSKLKMIQASQKEIQCLRQQNETIRKQKQVRQRQYLNQIEKLTLNIQQLSKRLNSTVGSNTDLSKKLIQQSQKLINTQSHVDGLNQNLEDMNNRLKTYQAKYASYIKQIDRILPNSVIIVAQSQYHKMQQDSGSVMKQLKQKIIVIEGELQIQNSKKKQLQQEKQIMKDYIENLESQVNQNAKQLQQINRQLQEYKSEQQKLAKLINQQRQGNQRLKKLTQQQKINSQKLIQEQRQNTKRKLQEQRQRMRQIQQQKQKAKQLLAKYQKQQQKLKNLINKEKQQTDRLSKQKEEQIERLIRQKQQQIQRQKQNNRLLWTDNKKLKDMQEKLRQLAKKQIQQRQREKEQQLNKMKKDMQQKYKKQLSQIKNKGNIDESNSKQLKKLLTDKANQIKGITQKYDKLNSQAQFYKNRNKELQGVVSRMEKKHKEALVDLQRQNKSNKQVILVFQGKIKSLKVQLQQNQKLYKQNNKKLSQQLQNVRNRFASMKVQQKMLIIQRSLDDMDTSLKTLQNTLCCNYCMQVVKQCVRVSQCGHIYCKKCKAGYEPNCGQCKKKGHMLSDRMVDDAVSKADYMRIVLGAVKDDLSKISLKQ